MKSMMIFLYTLGLFLLIVTPVSECNDKEDKNEWGGEQEDDTRHSGVAIPHSSLLRLHGRIKGYQYRLIPTSHKNHNHQQQQQHDMKNFTDCVYMRNIIYDNTDDHHNRHSTQELNHTQKKNRSIVVVTMFVDILDHHPILAQAENKHKRTVAMLCIDFAYLMKKSMAKRFIRKMDHVGQVTTRFDFVFDEHDRTFYLPLSSFDSLHSFLQTTEEFSEETESAECRMVLEHEQTLGSRHLHYYLCFANKTSIPYSSSSYSTFTSSRLIAMFVQQTQPPPLEAHKAHKAHKRNNQYKKIKKYIRKEEEEEEEVAEEEQPLLQLQDESCNCCTNASTIHYHHHHHSLYKKPNKNEHHFRFYLRSFMFLVHSIPPFWYVCIGVMMFMSTCLLICMTRFIMKLVRFVSFR